MNRKVIEEHQVRSVLHKTLCDSAILNIQKLKKDLKIISKESRLQEDLSLSSLEMISLITDLCDSFEIDITEISDVDLAKIKQVKDIAKMLVIKNK